MRNKRKGNSSEPTHAGSVRTRTRTLAGWWKQHGPLWLQHHHGGGTW